MNNSRLVKRWVPVDLIFASNRPTNRDDSHAAIAEQYALAPLVTIRPYMAGILSVSKGGSLADSFHSFEATRRGASNAYDPLASEKKIRSKLSGIGRLLQRNEPVVETMAEDRLLVSEGLLDACIAKHRAKEWIKVRMPEDVAALWDARPTTQLDEVCKAQNRTQIYTPIMHPAYRKFDYSRRGQARLDMMRRYLGPRVSGMTLLDIGCNCGYYVFHFRRQGMKATGIDVDREHLAIAQAQVPMYRLDVELQNKSIKDLTVDKPYDVVLGLSVFWHILGWGDLPAAMSETELAAKLEQVVGKCLFWESGPEPEREIEFVSRRTGLTEFERLGTTSATGIGQRTFGVFTRSP